VYLIFAEISRADGQAIEELKTKGITRIDIVLANAGVFPDPSEGMFKDLTAETAEQVWRVNVSLANSRR
jgi:NAD(P)-dependent dehydrogenase (short-subunit alcohol dehydrogenase family)